MNRKMIHPLLLTCALVPAVAMAFGNQTTWTREWAVITLRWPGLSYVMANRSQ